MSESRSKSKVYSAPSQRFLAIGLAFLVVDLVLTCSLAGCKRETKPIDNSNINASRDVHKSKSLPAATQFNIRDVSAFSDCDYHNGSEAKKRYILEIVGGGVGCLDFDTDGKIDLFFPRGGKFDPERKLISGINSALLHGLGNWEFSHCTDKARVDTESLFSHGVASVDYDQDGLPDLLVYGHGGVLLFNNMGDGTFKDVTAPAGLESVQWTTAAAWLDINNDQSLDLYLGSYVDWSFDKNIECESPAGDPDVCSPNAFAGPQNVAYTSNGDGTFALVPNEIQASQEGKTLSVLAAQFAPGEGTSLYVANDLTPNFLFRPESKVSDGSQSRYSDVAFAAGVAVDDRGLVNASMGTALLDFDLDHKFDIFVTNFEHENMALYRNVGDNSFFHVSREVGLNRSDLRVVGFGVVAADFDGDADEDIAYVAGHVHYEPQSGTMEQQPGYLQNESGQRLKKTAAPGAFFTKSAVGRGLATADFDNDGDLDLVATALFGPPIINENNLSSAPRWLAIDLVGVTAPRTPIGAVVEVTTSAPNSAAPQMQMRQLYGGGSYLSQSQSTLFFSWPRTIAESSDETATAVVRWPDGRVSAPMQIKSNQRITLVQQP